MSKFICRADSDLEIGDIVSIKASQCEASCSAASWFISNSEGLLVLHPDSLISSTAVVGSLFCPRRGVLSEWFRGIDGDSLIMVIGSLVHELLQEVILASEYCGVYVGFLCFNTVLVIL
jgi:DNA replication ATP-dependent helicase Dna2